MGVAFYIQGKEGIGQAVKFLKSPFAFTQYRIFLSLLLLGYLSSFSQVPAADGPEVSIAEKIYLQLASRVYAKDQTIWFKAVVTDSENLVPSDLSRLLYVDLLGPDEQVKAQKWVKLSQGIGLGSFDLGDKALSGRYQIRAYTQWNRNFGDDFFFSTYVDVLEENENRDGKNWIDSLWVERNRDGNYLMAQFSTAGINKKGRKGTKLVLDWGNGRDSLPWGGIEDNSFSLAYKIPERSDRITLTQVHGNGSEYTKTQGFKGDLVPKSAYHLSALRKELQIHSFPI